MRIVKLSSLSEKERKKVLEEQEERYQQNQQERQKIQKQANDDFVKRFGNGDTNPSHTTTYKDILNSMNSKEAKSDFKKRNNLTLWDQVKNIANGGGFITRKTGTGILGGIVGIGQAGLTDTANQLRKGENDKSTNIPVSALDFISSVLNPSRAMNRAMIEGVKNNFSTITNKDKNVMQKAGELFTNSASAGVNMNQAKATWNTGLQLMGKINNNLDDEVLRVNGKISKPVEELNAKLQEEGKQYDGATNWLGDAGQTIGNMVPSITASAVTHNPSIGLGVMGISAKGQATQEALNKGADLEQAVKIGDAKMLVEIATEKIAGGTKLLGKGSLDDLADEFIKKGSKSTFGKFLLKQGYNVGGEITEELISDLAGNIIDKGTTEPDKKIVDFKQGLDTAGKTAFTTLVLNGLGGYQQDYNWAKQQTLEQQNQNTDNKVINQEQKTSQNGFSQAEKTEALRQEARNKLESIKQNYDENSYNQMQELIETAPSEKALNQVISDLNKEAETKQVAPLKQKHEVQLPLKQETQNKSFEDVVFDAMNNYESNEVESPLKNRDMDSIGKQTKVNAYQYDNPKVKPYFQEMAQQMGEDLAYIASPENRSTKKGGGTKLSTSTKAMDILHNEQGYSYDQIAKGLQNIIDDKGSENNAISKKIELVIDEQLRNGYNNAFGKYVEPNQEYINTIQGNKDVQLPMKQENTQQTQEQNNNTKGENINWTEIERPEENRKFRKHYKSIIESDNTTAEAKSIAKELMGTDTYVPETNKGQLAQADQRIMTSSPEVELQSLLSRSMNGEKISSVDIAVGERLIQYFSKTGSKQQLQEAIQATAMAGTSAGQTVQALSMLNHQTPQGQATWIQRSVDKMNKELAKKKGGTITTDADGNLQVINKQGKDITNKVDLFNLTPEMIDKIMNSENQEQMYKNIDEVYEELGQQVPKSMIEKIDTWRYFSMLANARTHIRNMVGNVAMGKMQRVKDKIAGGIEDVVSKFNPEMERTKTLRRADAKTKDFAKQDFKNMEVQSRLELNENKYNPQSRLQNARRTFKSNAMENTLGRLFNLNDKLLSAEDGIGLKAGYQKALADYITANKIDVDNITDAQLNKARNYAVQQAKEATFHQANAIASAVAQFENKNLATKLFTGAVLPFKKTPMNVAKAGMEYSPLQIAKSATVDLVNLRKGNISVNQYIDNLSKGMTGTGIALVGYALANAGILKASGGDDKDKEKYEEEQGKQSYSIQIAGKTYSLDWLAPTGIPLFIGAETHKLFNQEETEKSTEKKSEEDRLNQAIKGASNLLNAGATAINPMSEMSMISGLTSALSSYNTSDNLGSLGNIMTNAGKSYVNQFFPTLMGQVAKTTDKYERTTKSTATGTIGKAVDQTINQIKNKIPGLRQTLPIKTDIWGKELKQEVNLPLRAVNNFINPATVKEVSTDKVDMELNKLYEENRNSALLPDILTKTVQLNKQTYRLSNKEYAEFTKNYGQTSHKLIENFIKTSDYNKLTQEQKETAISNIYSYAKEQNKMDYAKKVNETVKPSTLYTTMKEIEKNGGKQSEYLSYLAKTKGMSKESEKNKVLADSNYSNRTKEIIYTNGTGKDDNLYNNLLSKSHINMTEYLDYKDKVSNKVFSADKDKNGKTVTGSAKAKVINYLNNNITGVGNRLLIAGKSYALQNNERQKLAQYINSIVNTREERIEIYKQLDKNFYVRNEKVYMRVSK